MNLTAYISGNGIDISPSGELIGENIIHYFEEPSNYYSLKQVAKPETIDFVFAKDIINTTKFHRILIKEAFYACKIGGFIIINIKPNRLLGFEKLESEIKVLLNDKAEILDKEYDKKAKEGVIVVKKNKAALKPADSMDKWTFGIITNGKRNDWVEQEIKSIRSQNIPEFEIIVCGTYFDRKEPDFTYIPFSEKDDKGWITKKKNLICRNAKYENLVVAHDKFIFDNGWYDGMKKYGNYFEILGCVIHDEKGNRAGDWVTYGNDWNGISRFGSLDYKDWDKNGYINGSLYILKKSVWEKVGWDEELFWNEGEDVKLSKEWYNAGFVSRINLYSKVVVRDWRFGEIINYPFKSKKRGAMPIRDSKFYWWYLKQAIKKHVLGRKVKFQE